MSIKVDFIVNYKGYKVEIKNLMKKNKEGDNFKVDKEIKVLFEKDNVVFIYLQDKISLEVVIVIEIKVAYLELISSKVDNYEKDEDLILLKKNLKV